jgi:hypothetical protein
MFHSCLEHNYCEIAKHENHILNSHAHCMRAICKVHGLTLLLQVRTLWKCSDGFFFEVPPLASDATSYTATPTSQKHAADH